MPWPFVVRSWRRPFFPVVPARHVAARCGCPPPAPLPPRLACALSSRRGGFGPRPRLSRRRGFPHAWCSRSGIVCTNVSSHLLRRGLAPAVPSRGLSASGVLATLAQPQHHTLMRSPRCTSEACLCGLPLEACVQVTHRGVDGPPSAHQPDDETNRAAPSRRQPANNQAPLGPTAPRPTVTRAILGRHTGFVPGGVLPEEKPLVYQGGPSGRSPSKWPLQALPDDTPRPNASTLVGEVRKMSIVGRVAM